MHTLKQVTVKCCQSILHWDRALPVTKPHFGPPGNVCRQEQLAFWRNGGGIHVIMNGTSPVYVHI